MKLKRQALLALGLLAAEAVRNSKVREALDKLAENGVTKAAKLMEKASEWLREHGKKPEMQAEGSVSSAAPVPAKPRSVRKRRKAPSTVKTAKRKVAPRKKK
jgi:hypothetical protein